MNKLDYFLEAISEICDEEKIEITQEQKESIAIQVECAHENIGMAYYQPSASDHYGSEIKKLEDALAKERGKRVCKECNGDGRLTIRGPVHSSNSSCWKCNGAGYV